MIELSVAGLCFVIYGAAVRANNGDPLTGGIFFTIGIIFNSWSMLAKGLH